MIIKINPRTLFSTLQLGLKILVCLSKNQLERKGQSVRTCKSRMHVTCVVLHCFIDVV